MTFLSLFSFFFHLGYLTVESKTGDEAMDGQRLLVYATGFLQEILQNSLCGGKSGFFVVFFFFPSSGSFLSKLLSLIYLCLMSERAGYAFCG